MDDNKEVEVIKTTPVKKKLRKRILKSILIFSAIIMVSVVVAFTYVYIQYGSKIQATINDGNNIARSINETDFNTRKPTQFYDGNGKLLKEFKTNTYYYTSEADLNPYIKDAFTAIEDQRFYQHNGMDYKGISRSIWLYVTSKGATLQGGSTITQQLARNVFLTFDVTLWRKLKESVIALDLEKKYSKAKILEFYVNNINFGNGCYSFESAAQYYFQKSNKDLDLSQIALLTSIPNNPSLYDPMHHMDKVINRRDLVLDKMLALGKISKEEFSKAKAEVIKLNIKPNVKSEPMTYDMQYAVYNATLKLMEQDGFVFKYYFSNNNDRTTYFNKYTSEYAEKEKQLLSGRYRIDTSIDTLKQQKLQSVLDSNLAGYLKKDNATGLYEKQGASVTIDNSTGEVVAIVGGRSQNGNTFNRAFLGVRQPGSAIKPLIAYTPSFERGYIPTSEYIDEPINNGPVNDDFSYRGSVPLKYAVDISINTIPVRLVEENGVKTSLKYLQNMEFKYITSEDDSAIVAIGGFTKGVTPVEMASGYSTLSRNGLFISPTNVRKITNTVIDEVLFENKHKQVKVYDSGASYLMTDTLKSVLTEGYSTGSGLSLSNYYFSAGKTGTTDKSKDCWFVGYTPYYTTSVWVGDDTPAPQNMFGANEPGQIWKEYMEFLHQDLFQNDFDRPNTIVDTNGILMNTLYLKFHPNDINVEKENKNQLEVINKEDTETEDVLKKEQEITYEKSAKDAIYLLENFALADKSQYALSQQLIQSASSSLQNVSNKELYLELQARLQTKINKINEEKSNLENPPKTDPDPQEETNTPPKTDEVDPNDDSQSPVTNPPTQTKPNN